MKRINDRGWGVCALLLWIVLLPSIILVGYITTYSWVKVDTPLQKDVPTGRVVVGHWGTACKSGDNWNACINILVDNYNQNCIGNNVSNPEQCDYRSKYIDSMKLHNASSWSTLNIDGGGIEYLNTNPEKKTVPETNHIAWCYIGFLGECEQGHQFFGY
jgi:hypothetical protein